MTMPYYVPPEQLTKDRAEFARKGIARGRSIIVMEYADGVLLMGENPSGSLNKLSEVYDRIAFAGVGRFNEFESIRVAGIRYVDAKGYAYARLDVTARGLANAYSQTLGQIFTHENKPYEIEVMIAEIGDTPAHTNLYRITFDGTLSSFDGYGAMGGADEELLAILAERYVADSSLGDALSIAVGALQQLDERSIDIGDWEAAVLDRNRSRRKFHRLSAEEIAAALA